jgi:hypothetical protein
MLKGMLVLWVTPTEQPNIIAYTFETQALASSATTPTSKYPQEIPQICITRNHRKYLTHYKPVTAIYQDEISHAIRK